MANLLLQETHFDESRAKFDEQLLEFGHHLAVLGPSLPAMRIVKMETQPGAGFV